MAEQKKKRATRTRVTQTKKVPVMVAPMTTRVTQTVRTAVMTSTNRIAPLTKNFWMFAYIILALIGAQSALLVSPIVGIYINAVAFAALVGLALWKSAARQLAISAAILPVATMVTLSLPQSSTFAQTIVFYDTILLLALVYRFMFTLDHPLPYTKLTTRGYAFALPCMLVIGQILGVIGYALLRHHYTFDNISLPLVAATSVVFAFTEETFFRGLIQQRAALVIHPAMAAVLSAILYASATIGHTSILVPLFALLSGAVLSITYYKKQNLILTVAINAMMKLTYVGLLAAFIFR